MLETDEDALLCDLAETYGIYDMAGVPIGTLAVLASGLREDSRIRMKMAGQAAELKTAILAGIFDRLGAMMGYKGTPISETLTPKKKEDDVMTFRTPEEFEDARKRIING